MVRMARRRWLMAGAAAGLGAIAARTIAAGSVTARAATRSAGPPVARIDTAHDTYFGETLADPYRWMENDRDPGWLPWLKGQNDYTRSVLDRLPDRATLLRRIEQLSGDQTLTAAVQRVGARLFYEQRPAGAETYRLCVREAGHDRILVDPSAIHIAGAGHVSLDWWGASPDGRLVAYGLSPDGSENSVAHVLDVATGRDLPETIPDTQGADPQWLADGSGFFYTQLTGRVDTPDRFLDARARFHRIGTDPAHDPILMQRGLDAAVAFDRIQTPTVSTSPGSRWALLTLTDIRPQQRLYIAPALDAAAGRAHWVEVAGFDDEIVAAALHGDELLLLSNRDHPLGRVLSVPAATPALAGATERVAETAQVIEAIAVAADGLYLTMMDGGVARLRKLPARGGVIEIALPFDGSIRGVATDPRLPGALFSYGGWLVPAEIWSVDAAGHLAPAGLSPKPTVDTGRYATTRAFATARDGTRIPYALIYRKDLRRDGSAPAFIQAYGSYGLTAYPPSFLGRMLALVDAGCVVGFAYVRGGGAYGEPWHKAGQHANKPNTWRDLIDVCETLCRDRWTSPRHLAIGGRSAGGITVGRALTERPDLFAAVIDGVGWSNPLRYVVEQNGYGEEPEWGAISDPQGYRWLKAIDSYQHVVDHTAYPAVLLTTGVTDPRVAPFHVAKMAARLQAATSSGKPILLRVDYDAGHGIGSTRGQQDREAADTYAFLLWQTR
ncbi:S9 family peptidase [Endobacter medicaginis]|uniref:prolyl oligopeptidase n=2 Tax=Endobacter medicaginis TaxID=1181271 RepID=A0A850NVT7_9PROT|nr:prolyl oligopeptidase family serine peptidase [Endobacter medicaginis]NVN30097.1 S9 family peptidase [Endobacter medicaginis]